MVLIGWSGRGGGGNEICNWNNCAGVVCMHYNIVYEMECREVW